mmetsp:Transcript_15187/g.17199  ORF Transcript_15187/g.17199 Transcript_15187/m.17199 type:complete len:111 (+) Transcript_15187:794-1126(+)
MSAEETELEVEAKPKIEILYCTKCKWLLRASWMATELLSTFGDDLGTVSLTPSPAGTYTIRAWKTASDASPAVIWDRKVEGGFPYPKEIKRKIRDVCFPEKDLGRCLESK